MVRVRVRVRVSTTTRACSSATLDGAVFQMWLNWLKHAAERIAHVTCRAGQPASVHGHGPRSTQSRRHAQIWLLRLT